MSDLRRDSITARSNFEPAKEVHGSLNAVALALTDAQEHRPPNWNQLYSATANVDLPGLNLVGTSVRDSSKQSDQAEAHKIEVMITTGNASGLQRELQTHSNEELRRVLKIAHDDLARSGINLTTNWKFGKPVVYVEAEGGKTSVEFNDPFSIGNVPLAGTYDGGMRSYDQGAGATPERSDANLGLNRVLNEAMFANWKKQDEELARQGHPDWHVK